MAVPGRTRSKKTINPANRTFLLALSAFVFVLSSLTLIYIAVRPPMKQVSEHLLDYSHNLRLDFQVNLIPNPLYPSEVAPKNSYCFMNLTKTISLTAHYDISVSAKTSIRATSKVTGILEAYDSLAKDAVPIWQKEYEVAPSEDHTSDNSSLTVDRSVDLDLHYFDSEEASFTALTGVEPVRTILIVKWEIDSSSPPYGSLGQPCATLEIPISRYFKISGTPTVQKVGAITRTADTIDPRIPVVKLLLGGISLLAAIALVLAIARKAPPSSQLADPTEREYLAIKGKYRGRTARSRSFDVSGLRQVAVDSIEDLMRIADELGKPVIELAHEDFTKGFYVLDGEIAYRYELGTALRRGKERF